MQYQYWAPGGFTQYNHSYNVSAIIFHPSTTRWTLSKSFSDKLILIFNFVALMLHW